MKQCMKRELKTGLKRVRKTILHTFLVLFGAFQFPFFKKKVLVGNHCKCLPLPVVQG